MILAYLFIFILLIYFYIRIKTAIFQKRQKELESEVDMKTKSLLNLNKYLTERNQAKEHVLAIMNHDVLTPLKYLHMTANNLENQIHDINLKKSIHHIATTSKELEYLTSNMLNWVKFDNTNKLLNITDELGNPINDAEINFTLPIGSCTNIINISEGRYSCVYDPDPLESNNYYWNASVRKSYFDDVTTNSNILFGLHNIIISKSKIYI